MDLGRVDEACRQEEANNQTYKNRQTYAQSIKSDGLCVRIAEQQIRDQGGNAGGEHHRIHQAAQLFPLNEGVQANTQHGGDAVEGVDAPGTETNGEDEGQGGNIVGLSLKYQQQDQAHQAHHCHIEESGCIAAYPEIVGGDLAKTGQNLDPTGEQGAAVRHTESCYQEAQGEETEKQFQKIGFGEVSDLFHITPRK